MVFKITTQNIIAITLFLGLISAPHLSSAQQQKEQQQCEATNKTCLMEQILSTATQIENRAWRDKALREVAKSFTHEGMEDKAIALIDKIESPDTKALTIRGIGIAAADKNWTDQARYQNLFKKLADEAEKIEHKPSHAIAYTYIAMAQAFAKDDAGAMATAKSMDNEALRNKAYGETAEIQAERGDIKAALNSIEQINSAGFRNKAYGTVAIIFTKAGQLNEAYISANKISNNYAKAQALQKIVNYGNDEESIAQQTKNKN